MKLPDIDIDTRSDFVGTDVFPNAIQASRILNDKLVPHVSGFYFDNIPIDKVTNLAAIPFEEANNLGYFKVDLLHNSVYDIFESRNEIKTLIHTEPNWSLLENRDCIEKLTQIHNHADIVMAIKPKSINDLADTLALIRPGKRHLLVAYIRKQIDKNELYTISNTGYTFKKAHAVAYAHTIVLQMHLLNHNII